MMEFYDEKGINSWSKGIVPSFVTSNAFIGKCYARIISGYIADLCAMKNAIDKSESLYLVEVGGGSGKFAFHVLKAFECIRDRIDFPIDNIVYVLTDFTESNIKVWEQHPALKPFVESNRLDFAKFEAVNDRCIFLRKSGKILHKGQVKNPICIVANYVIDTLSHDIFRIYNGILQEGLVSIKTQELDDLKEVKEFVGTVSNIETKYLYRDIIGNLEDYYKSVVTSPDQSHIARILEGYRDYFSSNQSVSNKDETVCDGASLLLPIGFIKALRNLSDLSSGKALIITGDKGALNLERFRGLNDPHIAFHGSFSVMANFHAIKEYCILRGGYALMSHQDEVSLMVNAFVLGDGLHCITNFTSNVVEDETNSSIQKGYRNLIHAFEDNVNNFSPNDFYLMQRSLREESQHPSLPTLISLLKLSSWDCEVFFKFRENIIAQLPRVTVGLKNDLLRGADIIWGNYYHLDSDKDIAFELGRMMFGLQIWNRAIDFYEQSMTWCGEHHVTQHNIGLCYSSMGLLEKAAACFVRSLEMKPDYEKAKKWLEKIKYQEMASLD